MKVGRDTPPSLTAVWFFPSLEPATCASCSGSFISEHMIRVTSVGYRNDHYYTGRQKIDFHYCSECCDDIDKVLDFHRTVCSYKKL